MLIDSYHDDNIATGEQEDYDSETICDDQNEENEKLMIIDGVVCVVNYLLFLLYPPHRKFQIYEASSMMIAHSISNFLIN